jgi:lipopolysaccharide biosynthesis regulator YciM
MLTDTQRSLFREILDTNWEFEQEKDWNKKIEIAKKLSTSKNALKSSMGETEYNHFIYMGQQMFAPKK